jgi:hypothetical protein
MKTSTKHALAQRLLAALGLALFLGPVWRIPYLESVPSWLLLTGFAILFFSILSAFGIGPWGRALNRACAIEDPEYRRSLEPKCPWQSRNDV